MQSLSRTHFYPLNLVLEKFALESGARQSKFILLAMDRGGLPLSDTLITPSRICVEYLPTYSPELQPAERL